MWYRRQLWLFINCKIQFRNIKQILVAKYLNDIKKRKYIYYFYFMYMFKYVIYQFSTVNNLIFSKLWNQRLDMTCNTQKKISHPQNTWNWAEQISSLQFYFILFPCKFTFSHEIDKWHWLLFFPFSKLNKNTVFVIRKGIIININIYFIYWHITVSIGLHDRKYGSGIRVLAKGYHHERNIWFLNRKHYKRILLIWLQCLLLHIFL